MFDISLVMKVALYVIQYYDEVSTVQYKEKYYDMVKYYNNITIR